MLLNPAPETSRIRSGGNSNARKEFSDGVAFWLTKTSWPKDFHNSFYQEMSLFDGHFTMEWWEQFLHTLAKWHATRDATFKDLTTRFTENAELISELWVKTCLPHLDHDIYEVEWGDGATTASQSGSTSTPGWRGDSPWGTPPGCRTGTRSRRTCVLTLAGSELSTFGFSTSRSWTQLSVQTATSA